MMRRGVSDRLDTIRIPHDGPTAAAPAAGDRFFSASSWTWRFR